MIQIESLWIKKTIIQIGATMNDVRDKKPFPLLYCLFRFCKRSHRRCVRKSFSFRPAPASWIKMRENSHFQEICIPHITIAEYLYAQKMKNMIFISRIPEIKKTWRQTCILVYIRSSKLWEENEIKRKSWFQVRKSKIGECYEHEGWIKVLWKLHCKKLQPG